MAAGAQNQPNDSGTGLTGASVLPPTHLTFAVARRHCRAVPTAGAATTISSLSHTFFVCLSPRVFTSTSCLHKLCQRQITMSPYMKSENVTLTISDKLPCRRGSAARGDQGRACGQSSGGRLDGLVVGSGQAEEPGWAGVRA
jgi:hypothetical protein